MRIAAVADSLEPAAAKSEPLVERLEVWEFSAAAGSPSGSAEHSVDFPFERFAVELKKEPCEAGTVLSESGLAATVDSLVQFGPLDSASPAELVAEASE